MLGFVCNLLSVRASAVFHLIVLYDVWRNQPLLSCRVIITPQLHVATECKARHTGVWSSKRRLTPGRILHTSASMTLTWWHKAIWSKTWTVCSRLLVLSWSLIISHADSDVPFISVCPCLVIDYVTKPQHVTLRPLTSYSLTWSPVFIYSFHQIFQY